MTRKQKRFGVIAGFGLVLIAAMGLILVGLQDKIVFFRSPSDVKAAKFDLSKNFRLGGLVVNGTVLKSENQRVDFQVTDGTNSVNVTYTGLLPDLFREGQGVIAEGKFDERGQFSAATILAKHDETYMPREVADALKKQGHWHPEDNKAKKP